jgi:23S rRNA-/tRNA-specific pseudouridylate synthase
MIAITPELVSNPFVLSKRIRGRHLPALTRILEAQEIAESANGFLWDLSIEIQTGVMHQIRCHLHSVGWPILGDPIYHSPSPTDVIEPRTSSPRLWLHAWKLELPTHTNSVHPNEEARLRIEAGLPENWPI